MSGVEELSRAILTDLLTDFSDRALTANDLHNSYAGANLAAVKQRCHDAILAFSEVDFDLALKGLEDDDLIQTGPMVPYDNPPNSNVLVLMMFSKCEYAYLTEKGYKAAQKNRSQKNRTAPSVHISGGNFHQSQIGVGSHIAQAITSTHVDNSVFIELRRVIEQSGIESKAQGQLLAAIEAMQKAHNTPGFVDRYKEFVALAANYMAIIGPFLPALSGLLSSLHS